MPKCEVPRSTIAAAALEQNPSISRILVMLVPMVLTIRHPPNTVPSEMAVYAERTTHFGITNDEVMLRCTVRAR